MDLAVIAASVICSMYWIENKSLPNFSSRISILSL